MNCEGCKNKDECKEEDPYFHVGDVVVLKGRIFKVKNVKPSELRLKLVRIKK